MNLAYEWNDVALLTDQRAYTVICKTMLKLPEQEVSEIQEVTLADWTWQCVADEAAPQLGMVPFQGNVTLQVFYWNQDIQQETFFVDIPIQGCWQEQLTQQNNMRLVYQHTQLADNLLLLETVLQISRNQPLKPSQVLIGQFQMEEQLLLDEPWPACEELLTTAVTLNIQDLTIAAQQLQLQGQYQVILVYRGAALAGERVFVYEQKVPMTAAVLVPKGLQELNGIMPYYQSLTAQVLDEQHIQLTGSGVFCTLPLEWMEQHSAIEGVPFINLTENMAQERTNDEAELKPAISNDKVDVCPNESINDSTNKSANETTKENIKERADESVKESTTETTKTSTNEITKENTKENKSESTKESIRESTKELPIKMQPKEGKKEPAPSVVNSRGSRRANLSKYMRNLNNSVETPTSVRNFEISADNELPD